MAEIADDGSGALPVAVSTPLRICAGKQAATKEKAPDSIGIGGVRTLKLVRAMKCQSLLVAGITPRPARVKGDYRDSAFH